MREVFPLFFLDQNALFSAMFVLVHTALLAFILTKLLYKPVKTFLHKRSDHIWEQLKFAENEKTEASRLKADLEQRLKDIAQEKTEILDGARKLAAEKSKEQLDEAKSEAEALRARALREIKLEQERAEDEMKQSIIHISSAMAAKILTRNIDANTHERLFNETMAELEGLAWHD